MQEGTNMSFDLHLSHQNMNQQKNDHVERLRNQIKMLQDEREQLQSELAYIKQNPQQIIKKFKSKLMERINQLRQQNQGIQQLIQKSKIPGYAQMTKKKSSYKSQTPNKQHKMQEEEWREFERRNPFQSVQMSQKCQLSTCQNFPMHNQQVVQNPLRSLQPIQDHELRARAELTIQLLQVIDRTSQITQQMQQIQGQQHRQPQNSVRFISGNCRRFQQISKYKQRLLQLLKKLKVRENSQQQMIREYQQMHQETLKKFKQATQLLNELSSNNNIENLDDLYAEALQLQERLKYINQQLQKIDQNQWLKDIQNQLLYALKRLGLNIPAEFKSQKGPQTIQSLREKIDYLAQVLMECALNHRSDQKQKLGLLKMYHQQEKQNHKKIIKTMQNKQQALSKKLIDLQMNN